MKKEYIIEQLVKAVNKEQERCRIILEYIISKNSHPLPRGVDYEKLFEDIQDFEYSLRDI